MCVCVYMCVYEREGEGEKESMYVYLHCSSGQLALLVLARLYVVHYILLCYDYQYRQLIEARLVRCT